MSYKILFSDLDGTFLDNASSITEKNRAAVAEAFERGKQVVICSGRSFRSLEFFERQLGLVAPERYGIAFNGGTVYRTLGREILYERPIANALGLDIATALKKIGGGTMVYAGDGLYAENDDPAIISYGEHARLKITYLNDFSEIKDDMIKIIVRGEKDYVSRVYRTIKPGFEKRCNIFFSSETLLEFASPDTHKGSGLEFLIGYLGIPRSEVIAVGDQANDAEMLRAAGLGIAVANAAAEAAEAADVVLDETNEQDAVAEVIRRWLLS